MLTLFVYQSGGDAADYEAIDLQVQRPPGNAPGNAWDIQQLVAHDIPTQPSVPPLVDSPTTSVKSFASLSSDCWSFVSAVENPTKPCSLDLSASNSPHALRCPKSPERTSLESPVLPVSPQVHRSPMVERSKPRNRRSTPLQNSACLNSSSTPVSPASMPRFTPNTTPSPVSDPFAGYKVEPQDGLVDEFTRVSRCHAILTQSV